MKIRNKQLQIFRDYDIIFEVKERKELYDKTKTDLS